MVISSLLEGGCRRCSCRAAGCRRWLGRRRVTDEADEIRGAELEVRFEDDAAEQLGRARHAQHGVLVVAFVEQVSLPARLKRPYRLRVFGEHLEDDRLRLVVEADARRLEERLEDVEDERSFIDLFVFHDFVPSW